MAVNKQFGTGGESMAQERTFSVSSAEAPEGDPRVWIVAPIGDLDIATCGLLGAHIDEVIDAGATTVLLDLKGVSFLDSSGIRVIARAAREFDESGGRLVVERASGATHRTLEVAGIIEQLQSR